MILQVETPECWGHNFHVIVLGIGRVPQIKKGVQKYLLAVTTISYYFKVLYFFERKFSDEHQAKLPKMLDLKLTANSYWKFQLKWRLYFSETPFALIGHSFRVPKTLAFKTRLSAKPLLWKFRFYINENKEKQFHINDNNSNNNNDNNEIVMIKNLYSAYPGLP